MQQLTGQRKSEMVMMRDTVGGISRMLLILQVAGEYAASEVVAIANRLALIDTSQ